MREEANGMSKSNEYEDELTGFLYNAALFLDNFISRRIFMTGFNPVQCDNNPGQF